MDKAKISGSYASQITSCSLEQRKGADDVCLDKYVRSGNRAVDMTLGGQMDDGIGLILRKNGVDGVCIADVVLLEMISLM